MQIDPDMVPLLAQALKDYPANGKLNFDIKAHVYLREYGLVEEKHSEKQCSACGASRPDHYWHAITPAGRIFMAASGWAL